MRFFTALLVSAASVSANATVAAGESHGRPFFTTPTLTQIRDILAALEGPIVSTLVQRASLPVDASLYQGSHSALHSFLAVQERAAAATGRYDYGTLEYPFTLSSLAPDVETPSQPFPPGRFHLDTFYQNTELLSFYTNTIIPSFTTTNTLSYYFHLANGTSTPGAGDRDAALHLDAQLLRLVSHRVHHGKSVAEAKYAGNATQYAALIKQGDADGIRTLLTNTTQEAVVLAGAASAAHSFSQAWTNTGIKVVAGFEDAVANATQRIFRELIDTTTDVEIQYLLKRL